MLPDNKYHSPCKTFKQKKALACYQLRFNIGRLEFDHIEILRVVNTTKDNYYIVPIEALRKWNNRHISYHKSGQFHWREPTNELTFPLDGELDYRAALLIKQAVDHLTGFLDGYCFALGRKVSKEGLYHMVDILDGYILPPLNFILDVDDLIINKNRMVPMLDTPYKNLAQKTIAASKQKESFPIISAETVSERLRKEFGEECRVNFIEPQNKMFEMPSHECMCQIMHIADKLCEAKMRRRPESFWTDTDCSCF